MYNLDAAGYIHNNDNRAIARAESARAHTRVWDVPPDTAPSNLPFSSRLMIFDRSFNAPLRLTSLSCVSANKSRTMDCSRAITIRDAISFEPFSTRQIKTWDVFAETNRDLSFVLCNV